MYKIKLIYFKKTGKYYTEGIYYSNGAYMFDIEREVKQMRDNKKLPGIGGSDWIIYIDAGEHPNAYPFLIL